MLLVFLTIDGFSQNEQELFKQIVKDNQIKIRTTIEVEIDKNKITNEEYIYGVDSFGLSGNKLVEIKYKENGEIKGMYKSEFDKKGDLKRMIGMDGKGEITTILEYEFDSRKNIKNRYQKKPNGTIVIHQKRQYDSKGMNTKLLNRGRSKDWYVASEYKYNKSRQYKSIRKYNEKKQLLWTKNYKYKKGNLVKIYEVSGGKRKLYVEFKYDKRGNLTSRNYPKEIEQIKDGLTVKGKYSKSVKFTYNNEGMKISEKVFKDGKLTSFKKFKYKKYET